MRAFRETRIEALVLLAVVLTLVLCPVASMAGDGLVALQTADPSCPDDSGNIYVDCGNGTVTDNRTGLVWLANANCLNDKVPWYTAMEFVAGLSALPGNDPDDCGLFDGSSPGEWRLPSTAEWSAMIADAVILGCVSGGMFGGPAITNDQGSACWQEGSGNSFSGVVSSGYWTSTTLVSLPSFALGMNLTTGLLTTGGPKTGDGWVWPVRGGQ